MSGHSQLVQIEWEGLGTSCTASYNVITQTWSVWTRRLIVPMELACTQLRDVE